MREEILRLIEKNSRIDIHEMAILLGAKEAEAKPAAMARAMIFFSICILRKGQFVHTGRRDCRPLQRLTPPPVRRLSVQM